MANTFPSFDLALHYLASSSSIKALDYAKRLLDAKSHDVNHREPYSLLTPLHIAASWNNLAMCQLLIHYQADVNILDEDGYTPGEMAESKEVRRFLKKMASNSRPREKKYIRMLLYELFGKKTITMSSEKVRKNRPVSCFPAFESSMAVIRRRSSQIKAEYKKQSDADIEEFIASLVIDDRKESIQMKNNSMAAISPTTSPKDDTKPIYPDLNLVLAPSPPSRITSLVVTEKNESTSLKINEIKTTIRPSTECHRTPTMNFKRTPTAPMESEDDEEVLPQTPDIPVDVQKLTLQQLRKRLDAVGISPGPMGKDNRKLYEKKLVVAEKQNVEAYKGREYSGSLDRMVKVLERGELMILGQLQEDIIRNEFCLGPIISREKNEVSSFCYLLIDPSIIPDQRTCSFRKFIEACFYVGKGKRHRPLQHLIDAARVKHQENFRGRPTSEKLKRICKLWRQGHGVISLHIFLNIHPNEALIREAAMIDAFGVKNLTNLKCGEYSGNAKNWSMKEKTDFGAFCIYSAWGIFKNDRCRPIFESDVQDALNQKIFY